MKNIKRTNGRQHLAVPLVLQFLTGSTMVGMFTVSVYLQTSMSLLLRTYQQILSTLLTDLNPHRTSTSQAAYNLIRCSLGAAGIAALQAITDGVGLGLCFTIYGIMCAITIPLLVVLQVNGLSWRQARTQSTDVEPKS